MEHYLKNQAFTKYKGPITWFQILETAFFQHTSSDEGKRLYGDPQKGATIEQAWRTVGLLSTLLPLCIIASDKQSLKTDAIEQVIKMNSKKLV